MFSDILHRYHMQLLPGVLSQPVIVIQLHSLESIFPTRNEPFCSQSHVSTTIPLRPSCFLGITVSRYRKKDKMKWANPTPATDITYKIVFMLLREMPQGRRGQDPVGRTPGPCPDLNSRCYWFHWHNILSFSLRFCSSNSFSKHSLSVYVVPGTVVGASVQKAFMGLTILVVGEINYKPK